MIIMCHDNCNTTIHRGSYLTYWPHRVSRLILDFFFLDIFQVILPPLGEYDVMVQIKACALSRIDTKVSILTAHHVLIGGLCKICVCAW